MKKKYQIACLIILAAAAVSAFAFVGWRNFAFARLRSIQAAARSAPAQVVQNFYTWYISYRGNPLVDQAYRSSENLSPDFITYLDNFTQSGEWTYDPILCAQDIPTEVTAYPAQVSGEKALVEVTTSFVDHKFTVELVQSNRDWRINKVICNAVPGRGFPVAPRAALRAAAGRRP